MPSEPQPGPISQLPKVGDFYGGGNIPAPTDQDLTVAIVWHPHKLGANNGGWVTIQIPFGNIFDLPINTIDSIGLISQAETAKGAALTAAGAADKSRRTAQNALAQMQSLISAAASYVADAYKWAVRSRTSALRADAGAQLAAALSYMAQQKVNAARRQFSDSNIIGLAQSVARGPQPRVPRANDSHHVIANQVFGS